ncbi:MAG: tetratricopeptide repeat protein, partial [Stellaceae bacterium]
MDSQGENASAAAYLGVGRARRVLGELASAETVIEQGLARHRGDLGLAAERAEIAMAQRDWPQAITRWRAVLGSHGERAPANIYLRLARAHRLSGDLAAAGAVVRDGLTRHRNHPALMAERAEIAMAQQNWSEAIKLWQAVIGAYGEKTPPAGVYPRLARAYRLLGELPAAETVIREGLAQHRADVGLMTEHAEIATAEQTWPEAIALWQAVIAAYAAKMPPANVYSRLARAYRLSGDFAAAETAVRDGLARRPGDIDLAAQHAEIATAQEDWPEAIGRWRAVIAAYGEKAPATVHSRLGRAFRLSGDFTAAETVIRDGLERYPGDVDLAAQHAEIATAREDWPEAIKRWPAVIAAYGEKAPPASAYLRLARAHRLSGDLRAAEAVIRDGRAGHRDDIGLAAEHAEIAMTQQDWPEVVKRWQSVVATYGERAPPASVYRRLARAHLVQGAFSAAETVLRDGLSRHPDDIGLADQQAEITAVQQASVG